MYVFIRKSGHVVWKEWWYTLTSRVSLWTNLYITQEDQVFIADVVVIDLMWKMVALNVISWPIGAIVEFNTVTKICKYNGLHEGHHFIPMAMEVHGTPGSNMDCFIRECAHLFHDRWSWSHLFLFSCIQFFRQHVNIVLQHALVFAIERKIMLASDVCSRPPITIRSHDLHAGDIRGAVGKIDFYHERD
jgi:hypothetical protein